MDTGEIKKYIANYFKKHDIEVAESAYQVITHERYLNQEYLEELEENEVKDALDAILELTKRNYENRLNNRKTKDIQVTKVDIKGAVKNKYGEHPPFAKKKAPVEETEGEGDGEGEAEGEGGEA